VSVTARIRALAPTLAGRLVGAAAGAPIADLAALRRRLGSPSSVLCLGNGPSSELPEVRSVQADCLFRVNWIWRSRGVLAQPNLVFTADPDVPPSNPLLIAIPNRALGLPILARHCLALRPPRAGYLFVEDLLPSARPGTRPFPTNGALMIATAAALEPARLVISGMDLYDHPEGRYPGDRSEAGYAPEHSRGADLATIRAALAGFGGEVAILSPLLEEALASSD